MNQKIDYKHIPDLVGKNILSQTTNIRSCEKIVKTVYINDKGQKETLTLTLAKKGVLKRRNWAKFGDAKNGNEGVTMIGPEVQIEFVKNNPYGYSNDIKKPVIIKKPKSNLLFSERMKLNKYKKLHDNRKEKESDKKKAGSYVPPHKRNNKVFPQDFVVCVKNLPQEITNEYGEVVNYNKYHLKDLGEEFGDVIKAHVLTDRETRVCKGIGFIHYRTENEQEFAIHNLKDRYIGRMKINVEKAKNKK